MFFPERRGRSWFAQGRREERCDQFACCGGLRDRFENEDDQGERLGSHPSSGIPVLKRTTAATSRKRKSVRGPLGSGFQPPPKRSCGPSGKPSSDGIH